MFTAKQFLLTFINIHAHEDISESRQEVSIINVSGRFGQIPPSGIFSAGLHPWHLDKQTAETEWKALQGACSNENVLAVGECGLDKVCETDWILQQQYFIKQVELADQLKKPLIIHCVRAFEEVVSILRNNEVSMPVVFHGFNNSLAISQKLIKGRYYLSFGKHLLNNQSTWEVFRQTPIDKLFLETDAADISIRELYAAAADFRQVDLNQLAEQIERNAVKVFGEKILNHHE